jgi:hypothetical protein
MLTPLALALFSSSLPPLAVLERPSPSLSPAVQVWLSHRKTYKWGVRATVNARTSANGFLLVLQADPAGHVRVLFPQNPKDDQFVQGGRAYELATDVNDSAGQSVVLAVVAYASFTVDPFVRDGNWDLDALAGDGTQDIKELLLARVRAMQAGTLRYDIASYVDATKRNPIREPRYYATRDYQTDQQSSSRLPTQSGKIYYPFAYGYSAGGFSNGGWGGRSPLAAGALLSFPYRYDQFYRGPRKVFW